MYSYGASSRVGVGKRGHGGREYRAPRTKHTSTTPPPLKKCSCLCQLDFPEYSTIPSMQPPSDISAGASVGIGRAHHTFGGRHNLQKLERTLRSKFLVHFVVPGRKERGPVAIVGSSYHKVLAAVTFLLQFVSRCTDVNNDDDTETDTDASTESITGRIQRNVQDPTDITVEGIWKVPNQNVRRCADGTSRIMEGISIYVVFESERWNVMACYYIWLQEDNSGPDTSQNNNSLERERTADSISDNSSSTINSSNPNQNIQALQTGFDNFFFQFGARQDIEVFVHHEPFMAFGVGEPSMVDVLRREVDSILPASNVEAFQGAGA